MAIITSSTLGVDLNNYSTAALFAKGTAVLGTDGSLWEYVNALSAIAAGAVVGIDRANDASNMSTTLASSVKRVGVAQISIAVSTYGWVQRSGKMQVKVLASCAADVLLFTTSTVGELDDATISAAVVMGLNLVKSTASGQATIATAIAGTPLFISFWANPA